MELVTIVVLVALLFFCVLATAAGLPGNYGMMILLAGIAIWSRFTLISSTLLTVLIGLLIVGEIIEFLAGYLSAKKQKAGRKAQFAALAGGIIGGSVGSTMVPLIGSLVGVAGGAYLGTYLVVYCDRRRSGEAAEIAKKVAIAQAFGTASKSVIAIVVVAILAYQWVQTM